MSSSTLREPLVKPACIGVRTFPSGRAQADLPPSLTRALWLLAAAAATVGGWLVAVLTDAATCDGMLCSIATLDGRPRLLLILAGCCVLAMTGAALVTRGLTRANRPQLAVIWVAALSGVGSLLGVVALLVLAAVAAVMTVSILALLAGGD